MFCNAYEVFSISVANFSNENGQWHLASTSWQRPRNFIRSPFKISIRLASLAALLSVAFLPHSPAFADARENARIIERGKYVASIGGCNDCHTTGYAESGGAIPAEKWLTGSSIGFQGPWGTTYPANLRLYMGTLSESQWLARARQPMRPPMPWFSLRDMTDQDLVALYRFVRPIGPMGDPVPDAVVPGGTVATPYFEFVPKNLPSSATLSQQ